MIAGLDPLLADPTRLSIVGLLAAADSAEFRFVRDRVGLSDSALSKQAATLAAHGYLIVQKGRAGARARTWYTLSADGRRRLAEHVAALQLIASAAR